jgi:hypothetical protein
MNRVRSLHLACNDPSPRIFAKVRPININVSPTVYSTLRSQESHVVELPLSWIKSSPRVGVSTSRLQDNDRIELTCNHCRRLVPCYLRKAYIYFAETRPMVIAIYGTIANCGSFNGPRRDLTLAWSCGAIEWC